MKLKCDKHGRRLIVGERLWAHRTGDQSPCDGDTATIGDTQINFRHEGSWPKHWTTIDLTRKDT